MAHEWYVQQGDKQFGPLTSANLKKLATEGKISGTTSVRLGSDGKWVPASRVQGLFIGNSSVIPGAAAPSTAAAPATSKASPSKVAPVKAMPLAQVAPPPIAPPTPRGAMGSFVPKAQPAAAAVGSMPAKILGAVALVLGILALATCWLSFFGALGWIGIGVGSLGLVLGIAGFIVSARRHGSGLALNIAGTSSSVVGLVLTVVLGVLAGMFSGKPEPVVMAPPPPAPIVQTLEPEEPEEPAPPPEPVWTLASESIAQGPIKATLSAATIEQVRLESADLSTLKKSKPQPMLKVVVTIENTTEDRIVEVPGWPGGGDAIGQGMTELLGKDAGKALQSATATARLADNVGNAYKQVALMSLFGAQLSSGADHAVRPGKSKKLELVFPPPLASIEYLRIELTPAGFSGEEPLRFQIPKSMITGL